jgi:hypothetical protein
LRSSAPYLFIVDITVYFILSFPFADLGPNDNAAMSLQSTQHLHATTVAKDANMRHEVGNGLSV